MLGSDADGGPWPHEKEESWPDEPDEPDFDSLAPEIPEPPASGEVDNPETINLFVKLVVVFNAAVLGLALGPMFVVFLERWELGLQIFAGGSLLFAYGLFRYYQFRKSRDLGTDTETEHNG